MGYCVGIDLGTTFSAAALARQGRAEIVTLEFRSATIPSVLFLRLEGGFLIGEAANRRALTEPERVARFFKRRFGDTVPLLLGGTPWSADLLTVQLLREVLRIVTEREGEPPAATVVTHPANWGPYKIDLLRQAVAVAGVDGAALVPEPAAAAISYTAVERVDAGDVVAVYDLGGGTFDAAVLRKVDHGFELLGEPGGIERLGGIDFDEAVIAHVGSFLGRALTDLDPEDPAARRMVAALRAECVAAKELLSTDTEATIPVLLPSLQTEVRLQRTEFENLIRPTLTETVAALRRALHSADVESDQVRAVLLVGGSSRIPLVGELVAAEIGRPVAVDVHPKHAVALGAALSAEAEVGAPLSQGTAPPRETPQREFSRRENLTRHPIASPPTPASPRRGKPTGVVGRDRQLAALDDALAEAANGGAVLVIVEGDAGIGKTTLVEGWADMARDRAVVLRGRCDELGRDLPLQPVADALAGHLRRLDAKETAALLGDDAAALAPVLGTGEHASATVVVDTEAARARVFAALVAVFGRVGGNRPVVLVLEDLHLGGPAVRSWAAFACRRSNRTLLVVTARPGGGRGLEPTHRLRLGPLDRDAIARLVGADRAAALHERSGGHPLLLAAIVGSGDEALPATLAEAVTTRVEDLGDEVAKTLRTAAVLGPECDLELIAQVAGTPVADVLDHLEAAAAAGLIVERDGGFAFRHTLIREALDVATSAARRTLLQREAARALAARTPHDPLAVAVYARAGGDIALAASSFVAAAGAAAAQFDLDAAEQHLGSALALASTPEVYTARARVRMSRNALKAAGADAERAVALGGSAPALEVAGWVAYYRRRYDDARAYADEAAARGTDGALRVSALALGGRVRHAAGDLTGAVECLTVEGEAPPSVRGVADVWLAQVRIHQGRAAEALAGLARPAVDPESLAHPWAPLHLRFSRILALGQLGRVGEALRVVEDFDAAVERGGATSTRYVGAAANAGAWVLRWSGRTEEADDRNRKAIEATGGETGPSNDAAAESHYVALLDLADGSLLRGDAAEAATLAARLVPLDRSQGTMAWHQRHRLGLLRSRLALLDGDAPTAAGLAAMVAADAASRGAGRYELLARAVMGLADRSIPSEELSAVVVGLERCAVLDGWPLVARLASVRQCDEWRHAADRWVQMIVDGAGARADDARRLAARVLPG